MEKLIDQLATENYHANKIWKISCTEKEALEFPYTSAEKHVMTTPYNSDRLSMEILFISADLVVISGTDLSDTSNFPVIASNFPTHLALSQLLEKYGKVIIRVPYHFQETEILDPSKIKNIYAFPKQRVKYLFCHQPSG